MNASALGFCACACPSEHRLAIMAKAAKCYSAFWREHHPVPSIFCQWEFVLVPAAGCSGLAGDDQLGPAADSPGHKHRRRGKCRSPADRRRRITIKTPRVTHRSTNFVSTGGSLEPPLGGAQRSHCGKVAAASEISAGASNKYLAQALTS